MNNSFGIKFRLRQLIAVACLLVFMIFTFLIALDTSRELSEMNNTENIIEDIPEIDPNYKPKLSAGVTAELANIFIDAMENVQIEKLEKVEPEAELVEEVKEEPKKENKIYYINDGGYKYYFDEVYQDYIWNKLKEAGYPELYEYIIALIYHESKFTENIVSTTNDHGLMQINEGNLTWLQNKLNIQSLDNPYDNIDCGIYIICLQYEKYGTIEKALVAYNQGSCRGATSTMYSRCILQHDIHCLCEVKGE